MATPIKPLEQTAEKWIRISQASAPDYVAGVQNPRSDWAKQTAAAEKNYEAGVQASIARKGFSKGVVKAGTAKWQQNTIEKGSARWPQGISIAGPAYVAGFSPYHSVIAGLTLPARGPKGDPRNIDRVRVVTEALHKKKVELQSR